MDKFIDKLSESKIVSTLNSNSGYWHTSSGEYCLEKTSFESLAPRPLSFRAYDIRITERTKNDLTGNPYRIKFGTMEILNRLPLIYYYFSKTIKFHMTHLKANLGLLNDGSPTLKLSKIFFFQDLVQYLGHRVSHDGCTSPRKCVVFCRRCDTGQGNWTPLVPWSL